MRVALMMGLLSVATVMAQDEKPWKDTAELSWVESSGNAESSTLSFKNEYVYKKAKSALTFKVDGLRAESTKKATVATGSLEDHQFLTNEATEKTAERYGAQALFERDINDVLNWFVGAEWARNEFAGIDSRTTLSGGVGRSWRDDERITFKTSAGLQYTTEEPVLEVSGVETDYAAARLDSHYRHQLNASTEFKNDLIVVWNLNDTDDTRADLNFSLGVAMTNRLSLKAGLQFLYDRQPSYQSVPLLNDGEVIGTVAYQLDEWDTLFTTALVVNF